MSEPLEDLSRKQLQQQAKKRGIKANLSSREIRKAIIKAELEISEEIEVPDPIVWFQDDNDDFALGIEMYRGGFPVVSGDEQRTFVKVWVKGLPDQNDPICQLFYQSSGINSGFPNKWIPTNGLAVKLSYGKADDSSGFARTRDWHWFILKKPWCNPSNVDCSVLLNRFDGNPIIAYISVLMGNWSEEEKKVILGALDGLGSPGEKLITYAEQQAPRIQEYLLDYKERIPCDEYDIDTWVDPCTSWNWYAPYFAGSGYTPKMDPRLGLLWMENPNEQLLLSSGLIDSPATGVKYAQLREQEIQWNPDSPPRDVMDRARNIASLRQLRALHLPRKSDEVPQNLKTRKELVSQSQEKYSRMNGDDDEAGAGNPVGKEEAQETANKWGPVRTAWEHRQKKKKKKKKTRKKVRKERKDMKRGPPTAKKKGTKKVCKKNRNLLMRIPHVRKYMGNEAAGCKEFNDPGVPFQLDPDSMWHNQSERVGAANLWKFMPDVYDPVGCKRLIRSLLTKEQAKAVTWPEINELFDPPAWEIRHVVAHMLTPKDEISLSPEWQDARPLVCEGNPGCTEYYNKCRWLDYLDNLSPAKALKLFHSGVITNYKPLVIKAVQEAGWENTGGPALQQVPAELRNDKEVVLAAVQQDGRALKYASDALRSDAEVALAAIEAHGLALSYTDLQHDKKFVQLAINQNVKVLKHLVFSPFYKEMVMMAVRQDGNALRHASRKLKNDREIVLAAVQQNGMALEYASQKLKDDKEIVLAAVRQNWEAFEWATRRMAEDPEILDIGMELEWLERAAFPEKFK